LTNGHGIISSTGESSWNCDCNNDVADQRCDIWTDWNVNDKMESSCTQLSVWNHVFAGVSGESLITATRWQIEAGKMTLAGQVEENGLLKILVNHRCIG